MSVLNVSKTKQEQAAALNIKESTAERSYQDYQNYKDI